MVSVPPPRNLARRGLRPRGDYPSIPTWLLWLEQKQLVSSTDNSELANGLVRRTLYLWFSLETLAGNDGVQLGEAVSGIQTLGKCLADIRRTSQVPYSRSKGNRRSLVV
eukprot:236671-Prorocentrum_minimum.AAC.7